jgi:hypothetical protein
MATCTGHCCGVEDLPAETGCAVGGGNFCDGHGKCVACVTAGDCAPSATSCAVVSCTGNACVTQDAAPSAACSDNGGKACDGQGHCVECASAGDCPSTGTVCAVAACGAPGRCSVGFTARGAACSDHGGMGCDGSGHCAPAGCLDGTKDGTETDVDCGGSCPAGCAPGKACATGADCVDAVCAGGTCQPPSCSDGVRNGSETDVDCGGSCPGCADTRHCVTGTDCTSGHCFGYEPGTCVSCADGVKDGNETDVDCGGIDCDLMGKTCAVGQACAQDPDCTTRYCEGSVCAKKPDGAGCGGNAECANGHCAFDVCCHTACPNQPPSSCGTNGLCTDDGASCQVYGPSTACGTTSCAGGMITRPTCDGHGACGPGATAPCPGGFACFSAVFCGTICQDDSGCAPGRSCDPGTGLCH